MSIESYVLELQKQKKHGIVSQLVLSGLAGLEYVYKKGVLHKYEKDLLDAVSVNIPVISVGNITAGGTGKTPCIMYLAKLLQKEGSHPAVLSRGYKSGWENIGGIVSNQTSIMATQKMAGDEPYMMALKLSGVPVLVGKDRISSAEKAIHMGVDVLLLDDGFQYWRLKRDLDIVLVDCTNPFGYGHMIPRGLLREPLSALGRAHVFILTKCDQVNDDVKEDIQKQLYHLAPHALILRAEYETIGVIPFNQWKDHVHDERSVDLPGKKVLVVSGIGNPSAFAETIKRTGLRQVGALFFSDHHDYTCEDMASIDQKAAENGADMVVITEKDAVKIMGLSNIEELQIPIFVLEIEMRFLGEGEKLLQTQWEKFL